MEPSEVSPLQKKTMNNGLGYILLVSKKTCSKDKNRIKQ